MSRKAEIYIPSGQCFDCSGCTCCCRDWVVFVTNAEKQRISDAGWPERITDHPLFMTFRYQGKQCQRLAQRDDGRCVFLGDDGRCRLHAESSADIKPLSCRMYPFAPTPGVDSVRLAVRMDCPSVAKSSGRPLESHRGDVQRLMRKADIKPMASLPVWQSARQLSAEEFEAVVQAFRDILDEPSLTIRERIVAGGFLVELLQQVQGDKVRGERFVELLALLSLSAVAEAREGDRPPAVTKKLETLFRQWLFLHGLFETSRDVDLNRWERWRQSWLRYKQSRQFARGTGDVPMLGSDWPSCRFEDVSAVMPCEDDGALEPVLRSLRQRIETHGFTGPGYHGYDVVSGLTALWLSVSAIGWYARLAAVGRSVSAIEADDVVAGLRLVHRTFGVSPAFERSSERLRMRAFKQAGAVRGLVDVYGP